MKTEMAVRLSDFPKSVGSSTFPTCPRMFDVTCHCLYAVKLHRVVINSYFTFASNEECASIMPNVLYYQHNQHAYSTLSICVLRT